MIELHPNDYRVLIDFAGLDGDALAGRIQALAMRAHSGIRADATRSLRSTRDAYLSGLQLPSIERSLGRVVATIELGGALANMVESGVDPFDLRDTLLRPGSRKLRGPTKSGHYYRFIPFRHGEPDSNGRSGRPMGSEHNGEGHGGASRAFRGRLSAAAARALGRNVHRAASKLDPTLSTADPNRKVRYGPRLPSGLAPPLRDRHATDPFAGMYREIKVYELAGVSHPAGVQFITFRTITSDPAADRYDEDEGHRTKNWTHPGITQRAFFARAQTQVVDWLTAGDW